MARPDGVRRQWRRAARPYPRGPAVPIRAARTPAWLADRGDGWRDGVRLALERDPRPCWSAAASLTATLSSILTDRGSEIFVALGWSTVSTPTVLSVRYHENSGLGASNITLGPSRPVTAIAHIRRLLLDETTGRCGSTAVVRRSSVRQFFALNCPPTIPTHQSVIEGKPNLSKTRRIDGMIQRRRLEDVRKAGLNSELRIATRNIRIQEGGLRANRDALHRVLLAGDHQRSSERRALPQDQNYRSRGGSAQASPSEFNNELTTRNLQPISAHLHCIPTSLSCSGRDIDPA